MLSNKSRKFSTILFIFTLVLSLINPGIIVMADQEDDNNQNITVNPANGLKGDFYISSGPGKFDFHEKAATAVTPNINFSDLNPLMKQLTGQDDHVTVRWTGQIQPEYTEDYTFSMIGDNGFRLWIDDELIIDHWVNDWDNEQISEPISLETDKMYDLKIEYFEDIGGAHLTLRWESESVKKEVVPTERLFLPEGYTPTGPLTANTSEDGETLKIFFDSDLAALPENIIKDFSTIGNSEVISAKVNEEDQSILELTLDYPITSKDYSVLYITYDGENEDLTTVEGTTIESFTVPVEN